MGVLRTWGLFSPATNLLVSVLTQSSSCEVVRCYSRSSFRQRIFRATMFDKENPKVYKLVLTGGPCGGKTTAQSRLCTFFENLGWKVYRVPETATILLGGGIKFDELSAEEGMLFQENLLKAMLKIEEPFFELARTCKKNCLVICDRGAMDASAFIPTHDWKHILKKNGLNEVEIRDNRYNQVIHMVSAAIGAEQFYSRVGHAARCEDLTGAKMQDKKAADAWVGHPYFDMIDNSTDFETKITRLISLVCQKVGINTGDRLKTDAKKVKYLVRGPLPSTDVFPKFQDFKVKHIYLKASGDRQTRLRERGIDGTNTYTYTIRNKKLGQVIEVREQISKRDWNTIKANSSHENHEIIKTRRCFIYDDQYFQLDIYREPCHPRCLGLMLLETYTTHTSAQLAKRLPPFLSIEKEVTGKPEYSMYNLSLKKDWKDEELLKKVHNGEAKVNGEKHCLPLSLGTFSYPCDYEM